MSFPQLSILHLLLLVVYPLLTIIHHHHYQYTEWFPIIVVSGSY